METNMNPHMSISTWIRRSVVVLAAAFPCFLLSAGCSQVEGSRCNPAITHDECDNAPTDVCFAPTAAACAGEAYCCTLASDGVTVTSMEPNCQFLQWCQTVGADGGSSSSSSTTSSTTTSSSSSTPDAGDGGGPG
jgi:hypothetical protein